MKTFGTPRWMALLAIGVGGWAAGFGVHRWLGAEPAIVPDTGVESTVVAVVARPTPESAAATRAALEEVAKLKSTDTLDDLLGFDNRELYGRLALWLLDASTADLARFWVGYQAKGAPEMWVADLLFARWTQLDPDDALRAAGKDHQAKVWWAWAVNDPATAVARVAGQGRELESSVLRAIGQFHPDLLAKVMAAHPEFVTGQAIEGVAKGLAREDPAAAQDFLRAHNQGYDTKLLREWARDDPTAAFAWVQRQLEGYQTTAQLDTLIDTLERENPAALLELADKQAPGKLRRQMDAAIFRNLLDTDPAAALAQARATESPRLATERLAEAARRMARDDPEQAFSLFTEMFEKSPTAFSHETETTYPNGASGSYEPLAGVQELAGDLLGIDPRRALAAVEAADDGGWKSSTGPAAELAGQWVQRDLEGFSGWLDEQPAGPAQDFGTQMVVRKLTQQQSFQEAARRAGMVTDENVRNDLLSDVARNWAQQDRKAAAAWLDQLDLSVEVRRNIGVDAGEGQR